MNVTVELYGTMRDAVGRKRLSLSVNGGVTVEDILSTLGEEHEALRPLAFDSQGRLRPNVNVSVGETPIRDREGAATPVEDGDTLIVVPAVAGG